MTTNLDREFFEKKLGWSYHCDDDDSPWFWGIPGVSPRFHLLPSPSTSWNDFHEWVVPKLKLLRKLGEDHQLILMKFGEFTYLDKTPANALAWAMEEIPDAS